MNDLDLYLARAQVRFGFCVLALVFLTLIAVLACAILGKELNQQLATLIVQIVTGILSIAGSVGAFLYARHRPQTSADNDPPDAPAAPAPTPVPLSTTPESPK